MSKFTQLEDAGNTIVQRGIACAGYELLHMPYLCCAFWSWEAAMAAFLITCGMRCLLMWSQMLSTCQAEYRAPL